MTKKTEDVVEEMPDVLENQPCPMCGKDTLTLTESEKEIPYFNKVYLFSMTCSNCKYHKADLEVAEDLGPVKYQMDVEGEKDLNVRIVKSSIATVKIGRIMTIESGVAAQGFVTNVEGLLRRAKHILESARDNAEDKEDRKKAKNHLKKLQKVMWGQDKLTLTIEDPTGNSAIISDKAVKTKGKKK